jgi:hypothetical protein
MTERSIEKTEVEPKAKTTSALGEQFNKELIGQMAELSFFLLPFMIISIINLSKGDWVKLIQTGDWALASTLLFGQTIVKIVMGVAAREQSFPHQNYGLITALIIVFGLVPSITILTLFQINNELSLGLIILQFLLLVLAVATFLTFGTIGQMLSANAFSYKIGKMLGLNK